FSSFFFTIFLFLDFFSDFQYLSPGLPELKVRLYQIAMSVFYMPAVKISPWISEGFHKRHDRSPMGDHRRGIFIFPRAGCEHTLKPFQSPPAEFFSAFSPGKGQISAAVHPLLILRVACKLSVVFILKITEVRLRKLVDNAETFSRKQDLRCFSASDHGAHKYVVRFRTGKFREGLPALFAEMLVCFSDISSLQIPLRHPVTYQPDFKHL